MKLTAGEAVLATIGLVALHEANADEGQLISDLWDAWMQRRPGLTITLTAAFAAVTVAHLCNILERDPRLARLDPYSGFGYPVLTYVKKIRL